MLFAAEQQTWRSLFETPDAFGAESIANRTRRCSFRASSSSLRSKRRQGVQETQLMHRALEKGIHFLSEASTFAMLSFIRGINM